MKEETTKINICKYRHYLAEDMSATCLNPYCGPAICSYKKDMCSCPFFERVYNERKEGYVYSTMININKIHCDACEAVIQAIDRCSNEFKRSGVKNIEWNLLTIRKIDVEGLSERWLKIVGGKLRGPKEDPLWRLYGHYEGY